MRELQRTLRAIPDGTFTHVTCHGLFGTYDDGLAWLTRTENKVKTKCILSLGSSVGNFRRKDAANFLRDFAEALGPADSMLIGLDACQREDRVYKAYNDSDGITHKFYRNGLFHANRLLGYDAFKPKEWNVVGVYNESEGRHEAYFTPVADVRVEDCILKKGEKILLEEAHKYSAAQSEMLWHSAGLNPVASFGNQKDDYRKFPFPSDCFIPCLMPRPVVGRIT